MLENLSFPEAAGVAQTGAVLVDAALVELGPRHVPASITARGAVDDRGLALAALTSIVGAGSCDREPDGNQHGQDNQ